uniref:Alternative protein BRWD1 n=1 Tax=Homo sapiens TaxID=9606 RepID=L8E8H4_HUMAN|nr:alternative protein BRWD1 [Homo sapiens]
MIQIMHVTELLAHQRLCRNLRQRASQRKQILNQEDLVVGNTIHFTRMRVSLKKPRF